MYSQMANKCDNMINFIRNQEHTLTTSYHRAPTRMAIMPSPGNKDCLVLPSSVNQSNPFGRQ
jgi:hypothetical protein